MKTAISVPDSTFEAADQFARRLGLSRSELYSRAVAEYVTARSRDGITEALDAVHAGAPAVVDAVLSAMQTRSLARDAW